MTTCDTSRQPVGANYATLSLAGDRQENQDRVEVFANSAASLLVVVDGMGGHAQGARAAEITISVLGKCFAAENKPPLDPQGFLTMALAEAHDRVVAIGGDVTLEARPRATCAVCLVQDGTAYWAHVGDSRIYLLRNGAVAARTRDHSHVELLLREGMIAEWEMKSHPLRNLVECCLGGDNQLPTMNVTSPRRLRQGDVLLLCTDGLWSGLNDSEISGVSAVSDVPLVQRVSALAEMAVSRNSPHSDNTSVAVLAV